MKRLIIVFLMLSISLSAKDLQKPIGYDKIKLNLSAEELQKIIKTDYSNWSINYVDFEPVVVVDPNTDGEISKAYYELKNNSGISIIIYLTEGMFGNICNLSVVEHFDTLEPLYKQYYLLKDILIKKYGHPSDCNDKGGTSIFDYGAHTQWLINENIYANLWGSYCSMIDDKGNTTSCHSIVVSYNDLALEKKRNLWIENRRNSMHMIKYKNDKY